MEIKNKGSLTIFVVILVGIVNYEDWHCFEYKSNINSVVLNIASDKES